MNRDDWLSLSEACEFTGRARRTIYRWLSEGRIRTIRPSRTLYLNRDDLATLEAEKTPQLIRDTQP